MQEAIAKAQSGNREAARTLLLQLIQQEPANQAAWLWLADTCDTASERKAILSRAIKLNPNNPVLKQALNRIDSLGDTPTETPQLTSPRPPAMTGKPGTLFEEPDLGWLADQDETETGEQLETISDEEFHQLSQAFFAAKHDEPSEEVAVPVTNDRSLPQDDAVDKKPRRSLLDFLRRETEEQSETTMPSDEKLVEERTQIKPPTDDKKKSRQKKEAHYQAIEEELKQAFVEAEGSAKKYRARRLVLPRFVKKLFLYIGIAFVMVMIVLGGLFIIERYKQRRAINGSLLDVAPLMTHTATPDLQSTEIQQTLEAAATPTLVQFQDIVSATELPLTEDETVLISTGNITSLERIADVASAFPVILDDHLRQYAVVESNQADIFLVEPAMLVTNLSVAEGEVITGAAFSPDGSVFTVVTRSMQISTWALPEGVLLGQFSLPDDIAAMLGNALAFIPAFSRYQLQISADNQTLAFGYWGLLMVWDISTGTVLHQETALVQDGEYFYQYVFRFSPDGQYLAVASADGVTLLTLSDPVQVTPWDVSNAAALVFPDDDHLLIVIRETDLAAPQAILRDLTEAEIVYTVNLCPFGTCELAAPPYPAEPVLLASQMGEWFAVEIRQGNGSAVQFYQIPSGTAISRAIDGRKRPLYAMGVSPDGSLAAFWLLDETLGVVGQGDVVFWDTENAEKLSSCNECGYLFGEEPRMNSIQFSADGGRVAFCAAGYGCRIFHALVP